MKEVKCPDCHNWVPGNNENCPHCDHHFYAKEKEELDARMKTELEPMKLPLIKINESDSPPLRVLKYVVRFHQIVFFSIVSYLAWIFTWVAG